MGFLLVRSVFGLSDLEFEGGRRAGCLFVVVFRNGGFCLFCLGLLEEGALVDLHLEVSGYGVMIP